MASGSMSGTSAGRTGPSRAARAGPGGTCEYRPSICTILRQTSDTGKGLAHKFEMKPEVSAKVTRQRDRSDHSPLVAALFNEAKPQPSGAKGVKRNSLVAEVFKRS